MQQRMRGPTTQPVTKSAKAAVGDIPVTLVCVSHMYPIGVEQGVLMSTLSVHAPLTNRRPVKLQSPVCLKMPLPVLAVQIWLTPAACIMASMVILEELSASPMAASA